MRLLLLIILIAQQIVAQEAIPQAPFNLEIMNQNNAEAIPNKSALEIGFLVPKDLQNKIDNFLHKKMVTNKSQSVNPFLDWELLIEANFRHKTTGKSYLRHGFYYRKMDRDESTDYWKDVHDDFTLRVRFSPEMVGEWSCELTIKEHGEFKYRSAPLAFTVVESKLPGFIRLHANGRYFERDGKVVVPTGINNPSPTVLNNMLYNYSNNAKLSMKSWKEFNKNIERYGLQGGDFFRFFLTPSCSDIEFEELGNYYERLNYALEVDEMLQICERENIAVNFNMLIHTPIMKMADYYQFRWDYTSNWHDPTSWPFRDHNPVYAYSDFLNSRTPSDMFLDEAAMKYHKQRVRYIIARWGYSTAINCFEILSEPWHMDEDGFHHVTPYDSIGPAGDAARKAAHLYHKEIAYYIKSELHHSQHLLGAVGRIPREQGQYFPHVLHEEFEYNDSTWYVDEIDFISISYYSMDPGKMLITKSGRDNTSCEQGENSMFCAIENLINKYNKPVIMGEADQGDGSHYCSDLEGHHIDLMRFNLSGAAGHYIWRAFDYPFENHSAAMDEREAWPGIFNASDFFNQRDAAQVFAEFEKQGREKNNWRKTRTDVKEHQYILNTTLDKGVGYVYNRTFNVHNAVDTIENIAATSCYIEHPDYQEKQVISWRPKRMKIEGLKNRTAYTIKYYAYKSGDFVAAVNTRSSIFGRVTLEHPDLVPDRDLAPLLFYLIEERK